MSSGSVCFLIVVVAIVKQLETERPDELTKTLLIAEEGAVIVPRSRWCDRGLPWGDLDGRNSLIAARIAARSGAFGATRKTKTLRKPSRNMVGATGFEPVTSTV